MRSGAREERSLRVARLCMSCNGHRGGAGGGSGAGDNLGGGGGLRGGVGDSNDGGGDSDTTWDTSACVPHSVAVGGARRRACAAR